MVFALLVIFGNEQMRPRRVVNPTMPEQFGECLRFFDDRVGRTRYDLETLWGDAPRVRPRKRVPAST